MTCLQLFERLDAYHEGRLDQAEAEAIEQHLLACEECRADFRFQRTLKGAVAALPREVTPPVSLWPGIRTRGVTPIVASAWWSRRGLLVAAAILLMALSSAVTAVVVRRPPGAVPVSSFEVTEATYRQAAEELALALDRRRTQLTPAALAVVEQNLRIIDEAIRETQAALAENPGNQRVAESLWASWEKKLDLLERAAQHAAS